MALSTASSSSIKKIDPDDVLFNNINSTKIITLNRPSKLNSLNWSMIAKLKQRLADYSKRENLTKLVIQKSNGRAFCAGGDVASCAINNTSGNIDDSISLFKEEYSLDYLLATYPKPIVSFQNGITMGGGVGLSIHTPFRIATENTRFAMPEMDIGFFPDVGTSFALNKVVPSSFGWYLALTGENLNGWDNYYIGLSTHFIKAEKLNSLEDSLVQLELSGDEGDYDKVNNLLESFSEPLPAGYKFKFSIDQLKLIERIFNEDSTLEQIFEDLSKEGSDFALATLATLNKKSPLSLKVALTVLQRGSRSDIKEALSRELTAASEFMRDSDFNEGVSSKLIKKSKNLPQWKYKSSEQVTNKEILRFVRINPKLNLEKHFNITFNQYPWNYGLPRFDEIKTLIDQKLSKREIIRFLETHKIYKKKVGLKHHLDLVLQLKTELSGEKLKWKI
ncbi:hypothetical protein WICMUC_003430 [Wickerhamomyces mucosus]|uniref:3-hydroxyisobutyryl-CoA hydrolase n=1 Tax=Wickerhamomyces mucosus TaxID=1378264 RepID=A0A9P8PKX4_9ASCO|nr:hypothetical protein WICMUC_003430 [Wickerhamomyces mucosus]